LRQPVKKSFSGGGTYTVQIDRDDAHKISDARVGGARL
jgi:hypothetical protein